jgi:PucR family transcriptional regulator, purine catabolism regulatory protein
MAESPTERSVERVTAAPTVRSLLARTDLRLRLASPADEDTSLDRAVRWVHSSDLDDPTPFLSDGLVLLTTGTQFRGHDDAEQYRAYVRRLAERGVVGLGFGTEVVRDGIPPLLAEACAAAGMPLFEVPYRTPFIAVARAGAEAVAAEAFARRTWALAAQRAVSLAALRPDGLSATIAELARQLGAWVGLFDATASLRREHPAGALDAAARAELDAEVAAVLRRGARAGSSLRTGATPFTLQTLGRGGHLRGVVAIAAGDLDQEGRTVVTSVIAMAGLALEQNDEALRARGMLRAGVVHALRAGDTALARRLARELGAALSPGVVSVAVLVGDAASLERAEEWLDARPDAAAVFGRTSDGVAVALDEASDLIQILAERPGIRVGVSRPAPWAEFARAHDEALTALRRQGGEVARFGDTVAGGVLGALEGEDVRRVAAASLAPLIEHDEAHATELVATVHAWLAADARIDGAAVALGVHRHTVRARIAQAERVLGVDLASFPARAELWAALRVTAD